MKYLNIKRALVFIGALCLINWFLVLPTKAEDNKTFEVGKNSFLYNGMPFIIKAAELHYPRIPMAYWDQRIKMCKALGMNTICLYTFWNVHESKENEFDFTGQNDIRHFIQLCNDNDMLVILRPGPYVCAEWEMGGLPWWLLKKKDIRLRDNDPYFMERVELFETELASQIKDLTVENGGPVIMIQVENEYGAYGENKYYVSNIRDILRNLYGKEILMFQCDWSSNFTLNGLDDLVWTMNFGTGADIEEQFASLKELRPESPLMCSEFWSGWFDKWGAAHETRPAQAMTEGIREMLENNISFSLYMAHGGTNWGHWAGANSPGYAPDVTSYDYDAPINESGNPTEKFWLLRKTLQEFEKDSLPKLPSLIKSISVDTFQINQVAPLWLNLPNPVETDWIKTMEEFDQGYGSIMYSTTLPKIKSGAVLNILEPHDYARVFINGKFIGKLDRRLGETQLTMPDCDKGDRIDIFVEAMGRINFGVAIKDFKGITDNVYYTEIIDGIEIENGFDYWNVYLFPDELPFYDAMTYYPLTDVDKNETGRYPMGVYKGKFYLNDISDTFLNFETWGKGLVYVNGHALGRIWDIGPQQTLYTPGCWLKIGENEIMIFDILGPKNTSIWGIDVPVLDKLQNSLEANSNKVEELEIGNLSPLFGGAFPQTNGWKRQIFEKSETGRYLIVEILSADKVNNFAAISEFYVLNEKGERISRESWKILFSDSDDMSSGNNSADKIFDLQESTYWKSKEGIEYPVRIVIDMGKTETVYGIEYLPRMESGAPGAIEEYQIYITSKI